MLWNFESLRAFSLSAPTKDEKLYVDSVSRDVTYPVTNGAIGKVRDFYFDDETWTVRYLVVDTGSWLSGRRVLILPNFLRRVDRKKQTISVSLTKEQVEESPSIDTDKPVSRQHETEYLSYYRIQPYWLASGGLGFAEGLYDPRLLAPLATSDTPRKKKNGDPHLRSSREVTGYRIEAHDGHVGHVEDFIVDDQTWRVHYLVVDTRDWWPGKMVLVAPAWIKKISWRSGEVSICLPRAVLRAAPEYDASRPTSGKYEQRLLGYYKPIGGRASAATRPRPGKARPTAKRVIEPATRPASRKK